MNVKVELERGVLTCVNIAINVSNNVRQVAEGTRRKDEVVRSIPANLPYDPQRFPKGKWHITGIEWQEDKEFDAHTYGPVKIRTDARQSVAVWELDGDGDYLRETSGTTDDTGYLMHYSESKTTLGCIRIDRAKDAVLLAKLFEKALKDRDTIFLEVV